MAHTRYCDTTTIDPQTAPGEDFYQYAVGGWQSRNPIPDAYPVWSSFHALRVEVEKTMRAVILRAAAAPRRTPEQQKVVDLYKSGLHPSRNRRGSAPLDALLERIDAITTEEEFARAVAECHAMGVRAFFTPFVEPDEKRTDVMALYLYQGGLTLPERTYYCSRAAAYTRVRRAYRELFTHMGTYVPRTKQPAFLRDVLQTERTLAIHSRERAALRDVHKQYNKMTVAQLRRIVPSFDFVTYFRAQGVTPPRTVIVGQPEYMRAFSALCAKTSLRQRKRYLAWRTIVTVAPYLSEDIARTHFAFFGTVLSGTPVMRERWKRVVSATDAAVGEALGAMWCAEHFSSRAKRRAEAMVQQILSTFGERIRELPWMEVKTKRRALRKLSAITVKIGYPETPKTYDTLVIDPSDFFGNMIRAHQWHHARDMERIGAPTDRTRWEMTAPTVNAYYHPSDNTIVFPAGILQWPFFHEDADVAINYGGIGTIIAHEISHAFDDQGSQCDARGNLNNWWTARDRARFRALTKRVIAQFDAYEALPGLFVNGALTVGENIADLGGLAVAYDALCRTGVAMDKRGPDGFTRAQRFFLAYALTEATNIREEYLRQIVVTDPHAPARFRVNGPVTQIDAWYDAFHVTPTDTMYRSPRERISIW